MGGSPGAVREMTMPFVFNSLWGLIVAYLCMCVLRILFTSHTWDRFFLALPECPIGVSL